MSGTEGRRQVRIPVADIRDAPSGGARTRQLLFGETVTVTAGDSTNVQIRADRDGYTGWMRLADLCLPRAATHRVAVAATHLYSAPDLKSPESRLLSFSSLLTLEGLEGAFHRVAGGLWVPAQHVRRADHVWPDPVTVAALFLGTPYLWGGNSRAGIDCSGLVQVACLACGIACPGDSHEQETTLGSALQPGAPLQRGDLIFWRGHVAWVADPDTVLHANAGAMAVSMEPLDAAIDRIAAQGDGAVTSCRRLRLPAAAT